MYIAFITGVGMLVSEITILQLLFPFAFLFGQTGVITDQTK
jgi:hypothetical protein